MAVFDGGQHFLFGGFLGSGFHHYDAVFGTGHYDVKLGAAGLGVVGLGNQLPIHGADAYRADQVMEWDLGNGESRAVAPLAESDAE